MLVGSIQGFVLCTLLAFHPQYRRTSNLFLILLIVTISVQNVSNSLIDIGFHWVEYVPLSWTLLIPFTLQFFVIYLIDPSHKLKKAEWLLLAPFAFQLTFKVIFFALFQLDSEILKTQESSYRLLTHGMEVIAILWCLYVILNSSRMIRKHELNLKENFSELKGRTLLWLDYTLKATAILWVLWAISFIYNIMVEPLNYLSYFNWIGMATIIYWIAYSVIVKRTVFEIPAAKGHETADSKSQLPSKADEYYQIIRHLMEEEKLFLTPELNMDMLSDKVGISSGYISSILNKVEGKNFFDFINNYRVAEVKAKIADPSFSHLSLLGMAYDSGFTSKSTFNAVFKKSTGMTPSAYKASRS